MISSMLYGSHHLTNYSHSHQEARKSGLYREYMCTQLKLLHFHNDRTALREQNGQILTFPANILHK